MDESDADQILAIDELRALRDRMGAPQAAPTAVTSAAAIEPPAPLSAGSPAAGEDPWEALRRQAKGRRRWGRLIAGGGGLALTAGAVAVLMITAHSRSVAPAGVKVPTVSAVPVSPAGPVGPPANGPVAPAVPSVQPSAVLPLPAPAPSAPDQPGAGSGQDATTQPAPAVGPETVARHPARPPAPVHRKVSSPPPADPPVAPPPQDQQDQQDQPSQQSQWHWKKTTTCDSSGQCVDHYNPAPGGQ